jgi:hypothetical protein
MPNPKFLIKITRWVFPFFSRAHISIQPNLKEFDNKKLQAKRNEKLIMKVKRVQGGFFFEFR